MWRSKSPSPVGCCLKPFRKKSWFIFKKERKFGHHKNFGLLKFLRFSFFITFYYAIAVKLCVRPHLKTKIPVNPAGSLKPSQSLKKSQFLALIEDFQRYIGAAYFLALLKKKKKIRTNFLHNLGSNFAHHQRDVNLKRAFRMNRGKSM